MTKNKLKPYSKLSSDEKELWENRARALIYPDLRGAFVSHDIMIDTLAKTLYKLSLFAEDGFTENPGVELKKLLWEKGAWETINENVTGTYVESLGRLS